MRAESGDRLGRSKLLREHLRDALFAAHRRRPTSFYMLLITPIVLLLGVQMAEFREQPWRFAAVLALLFVFCGVVLFLAVLDIFAISRRTLREHREAFRETLGDEKFYEQLGKRVDGQRDE